MIPIQTNRLDRGVDAVGFAVSAYGDAYAGMLLTTVESILGSNPASTVTAYWQGISRVTMVAAEQAYADRCRFIETSFDLDADAVARISLKTVMWEHMVRSGGTAPLCLLDCDTLVVRDIAPFFGPPFDVGFTAKPEIWPLNTGVLLVRNPSRALPFFERWRRRTIEILTDPGSRSEADSEKYPFGGADQMALHQIIEYDINETVFVPKGFEPALSFRSFPCQVLNETRSVPVVGPACIYHYKGGWHPILKGGASFGNNRPWKLSRGMYLLYLEGFWKVLRRMKQVSEDVDAVTLGITLPGFVDVSGSGPRVREWLYPAFALFASIRRLVHLSKRLLKKSIRLVSGGG